MTLDLFQTDSTGAAVARPALRPGHSPGSGSEARAQRDEGLAQSEATAGERWMAEAAEAIRQYALTHSELFCDDLHAATGWRYSRSRAFGAAILRAAKAGRIERTDRYRPSTLSTGSPKPVWKSLIARET